jgi:hypothetical protein
LYVPNVPLNQIKDDQKTPEVCLAAVSQDGYALDYVPDALKTWKVCLAAVQKSGSRACSHYRKELKVER